MRRHRSLLGFERGGDRRFGYCARSNVLGYCAGRYGNIHRRAGDG